MLGVGQSAKKQKVLQCHWKKRKIKACGAPGLCGSAVHVTNFPWFSESKKGSQSAAHAPGNGEACDQQQSRRSSLAQPVRKRISVLRALRGAWHDGERQRGRQVDAGSETSERDYQTGLTGSREMPGIINLTGVDGWFPPPLTHPGTSSFHRVSLQRQD